jgi:hypothetical protein
MIRILGVVLASAGVAAGLAADDTKPSGRNDYRWEKEAKARNLSEAEVRLLRENKFVIGEQTYRQIFDPYVGSKVPVFITADSLLNGYHVLFEESVYRLEQARARKLPGVLAALAKDLDRAAKAFKGDAALIEKARKRAAVFLGVARHLLDAKALPEDRDVRALVEEEVARVVAGKETRKPAWLGPPDEGFAGLDYSRFQPRGFYTKSPALQRYFRAVSWLQAIPFRLDNDEEAVAFFLLHRAYRGSDGKYDPKRKGYWEAFRKFLGTPDDWDLPSATELPEEITRAGLAEVRKKYRDGRDANGRINDQVRLPGRDGKLGFHFRFLSAYRTPDGVLFQRTMSPELAKREYPTGLEVCAALGSSFARDRLTRDHPKVMKEIEKAGLLARQDNLYAEYLKCLGVLLEWTEPDAPALFRAEAWKIKTCQTALSGWAQLRHTWALQAKQGAMWMSQSSVAPGFVEPVPEFYGRLAELVDDTSEVLRRAGALDPLDPKEQAKERTRDLDAALEIVEKARKEKKSIASLSEEEKNLLIQFDPRLNDVEKGKDSDKALSDVASMLRTYKRLGKDPTPEELDDLLGLGTGNLASKWSELGRICHRLEVMAHKQLRQVPFSAKENKFLEGYGKQLARIMLYGGNSYFTPRDDAPRVVDVFSNPRTGKYFLIGTARPRALWVLYPVKGVDVLCRGAVLPYHEFAHPRRLTDAGWKALLDSSDRPQVPAWIKPVMTEKATGKPSKAK